MSEPVVVPKKIVNTPIVKKSSVESKVDGVFPASSKNGSKLEWNPKMKTPQDIFYLDRNGIRQTEFEGKGVAIKGNRTGYTMDEYLKNNGLSKSDFTLLEGTKGEDGLYILNDKGNKKLLNIKSQNVKQSLNKPVSGDTIPEGYFKNAFGEIQKNPSNKKGGFIKIPEIGKKSVKNPLVEEARKYKISNNESYLTVEGNNVILNSKDGVKSIYNKFDNPEEANIGANLASKRLSGEDIPTFKKEFAGSNESGFNNIKSAEIELAKIKSKYKDYDFEIKPKRMGTINKSATDRYIIIAKLNKEALKKYGVH